MIKSSQEPAALQNTRNSGRLQKLLSVPYSTLTRTLTTNLNLALFPKSPLPNRLNLNPYSYM